jgi:hypothetical protein
MRSISISDEAWGCLKNAQIELMKSTGKVQTIGSVASSLIVKGVQQ